MSAHGLNSTTGTYAGVFPPGGCFITGHDLETGKQLWRLNTIAQADEPGGDTWNNPPNEKRGGGAIWVAGRYDPELNLTYWGTGPPRRGRPSLAVPSTRKGST